MILQSCVWFNMQPFFVKWNNQCQYLKEFICKFIRDLYVYDSSSSFDDIEDAYSFYKRAKSILNLAQFDLCNWETNDIRLKRSHKKKDRKLARGYCLCYCKTFSIVPDSTEYTKILLSKSPVHYLRHLKSNNIIGQRKTTNKEKHFYP